MNNPLADLAKQATAYLEVGVFIGAYFLGNAILKKFVGNDALGLAVNWAVPLLVSFVVSSLIWGRPKYFVDWVIQGREYDQDIFAYVDLSNPSSATNVNEIPFAASLTITYQSLGGWLRLRWALSRRYYVEVAFEPPDIVRVKDQNHGTPPPGGTVRADKLAIQLHVRASHGYQQVRLPGQLVGVSLQQNRDRVYFHPTLRTRAGGRSLLVGKVSSKIKGLDVWS